MKKFTAKRQDYRLDVKTFAGKRGHAYIVFRARDGSFHVFVETEAKAAARDCGVKSGNTRQRWERLWKEQQAN